MLGWAPLGLGILWSAALIVIARHVRNLGVDGKS